ncbi:hypothetical protein BDW71DRAFT_193068 [Aspergillus fruticulosus]
MQHLFPLVVGTSHLLAASAEDVTCYKPDGTSRTFNGTILCNSVDGAVSMCCGWNDICLQNGLCKVKGSPTSYWRDMCSISSWPDVGCLKACTDDAVIDELGNAVMTPCDGTDYSKTWCCGQTTDCCGTDEEITVRANIYVSTSTPTSTSTLTSTNPSLASTPATTSSGSTATPSSEQSQETSGLSSGAKAGIGVGVAAGAIAVVGFFSFFVIRRRRKRAVIASKATSDGSVQPNAVPEVPQEFEQNPVCEMPVDNQNTRYELPAGPSTVADRGM